MTLFLGRLRNAEPETVRMANLVVAFSLGTSAVALVFTPITYLVSDATAGGFVGVAALLIGLSSFAVRWTRSVAIATQCYLVSVWILLTGFAVLVGGMTSPSFPTYSILILGAMFLGGRRSGIVWTVISVFTILIAWWVRGRWIDLSPMDDEDLDLLLLAGFIAIVVLIGFLALQYDKAKNQALAELAAANRRTSAMIAQLEQASSRLVSSSERFLGSGEAMDRGLVGAMLHKARDGRAAIEESRESITGMIGQYRRIADRVQQLYEHSKGIVEVVATIDRISNRLDLMALNVGIEAAHGGESGKQFTILADDMRLLAERVLAETWQIKRALRRVQERVREVLESSTSGQALTEESAAKMNAMAAAFDDIYTLIEETEGATGQITADTLAQINAVRNLVTAAGTQDRGPRS